MDLSKTSKKTLTLGVVAVVLVATIIALIIILSGGGGTDKKTDEIVENALASLEETWIKVYDDITPNFEDGPASEEDRKLEIRGVRVITAESIPGLYDGLSYVVEFELYSNRYRTEPYLVREDIYTTVLIFEDGRAETVMRDFLKSYADDFENDFIAAAVRNVKYFPDEYAAEIDLNNK